jgi:hypothetical protein
MFFLHTVLGLSIVSPLCCDLYAGAKFILILKGSDGDMLHLGLLSFALCPSSSILKEHNVSETGSVSGLRRRVGEGHSQLGSVRKS